MSGGRPRLTDGSVGRHLVNMTVPVLFGVTTMMAQSLFEAWFVGRVGKDALAAYGFSFPILMIVASVAIGISAGTSSVVARALGAADADRARRLSTDSLLLSFLVTGAVAVVGALTIDPLFLLLGAPEALLPELRGYMELLYAGVPFMVVGMVGMATMRATGDTRLPSLLMVGASILQVALDPLLIFGFGPVPGFGLKGAAMAALIARLLVLVGTLYLLARRYDMLSGARPGREELVGSWRAILHVGLPAAGTNVIVPAGTAAVTALIARFGADAVAGFGVAIRVEAMVLVQYYALSAIIGPFVGQNLSADRRDRILSALRLCAVFCTLSTLAIAALLALLAGPLPTLFSDSESVNRVTRLFFWIVPLSYGGYGIVMIACAAFNGIGRPMPAMYLSLARIVVLYLPLSLLLSPWLGVSGVFAGYGLANLAAGCIAYVWFRRTVHALPAPL